MNDVAKITEQKAPVAATPAALLEVAINQNADLDKLEKLMELQTRWEENEARKAFVVAMNNFQQDCPTIIKNKQGHNSNYATLAHTLETIGSMLSEFGLSHSWRTEQHENQGVTVTCCVTHRLGHKECTSMFASPDASGSKNNIQAIGSTVSYLQRYTLYSILGLASKDDDGSGATAKVSEPERQHIMNLIDEVGADTKAFLKYFNIPTVADLPQGKYQQAVKSLEAKKAKK